MRLFKTTRDSHKPLHWLDDEDTNSQTTTLSRDSDWLVDHTGYTEADDNALDMLDVIHTLPDPT